MKTPSHSELSAWQVPNADADRPDTVLVCDDEELMRNVAGRILERAGFTVLIAEDGDAALQIYRDADEGVDLVLLDLSMPRESGLDVFRRLKQIDPGVRVLFSSGFGDDARLRAALDEGAAGILQKPYTMNKMIRAVNRAIRGER